MIEALFAAGLWGCTDVLAGSSSRRSTPTLAAVWLHLASLIVLFPFLFVERSVVLQHDLAFGAMAGVAAAVGDVLFGKALVKSEMSVGIPLANVIAAALPSVLAFAQGEHATLYESVGIVGALLATAFASMPSASDQRMIGVGCAVSAGLLFGVMYALLSQCQTSDIVAVVFVMRLAGTAALLPSVIALSRSPKALQPSGIIAGTLSGVCSVGANVLYVAAATSGDRVVHSVIAIALASPAAVLATLVIFRERLTVPQSISTVVALASLSLFAVKT